ncbi:hypothetical protein K501DRAFT_316058 [Backusella circina FSU 941]|nr:hypothetical protein K501DRAFT_316058 [Backusella circina FSU 941]
MDKFPVEVLNDIFIPLSLEQKMECMLVCKKWEALMREHFLFETVTIHWSSAFSGFFKLIKQQPWRGAQVKCLILKAFGSSLHDEQVNFDLFPNLRVLYLNRCREQFCMLYDFYNLPQKCMSPLMSRIKILADYNDARFAFQLLSLGTCSNLTSLEVGKMHNRDEGECIVSVLGNAPALVNLKIKGCNLRLEDIERIHTNLPLLESLLLDGGCIRILSIPCNITPAKHMRTLGTTGVNMISSEPYQWTEYIVEKYTALLSFRSWRDVYLSQEVFYEDLNRRKWKLFLKELGQQLQSLEVDTGPINSNLLEILDGFNYRLDRLAIYTYDNQLFSNMEYRNQCKYLKELKLYDVDIFQFKVLKELKAVKLLNIRFYEQPRIDVSYFLEMCPNGLETLQIESANLECPTNFRNYVFWIKKLTIKDCTLADNIDRFLSYTCLKLRDLAFLSYEPVERDFIVPNLALSRFEILTPSTEKVRHLLVGALDDRYRFYRVNDKIPAVDDSVADMYRHFLYDPIQSTSRKSLIWEIYTTLVCSSVKTIVFNNRLVC